MKKPILIIERYDGIYKKAVNLLSGALSGYTERPLPIKLGDAPSADAIKERETVVVGSFDFPLISQLCELGLLTRSNKSESYSIYVGKHPKGEGELIAIAGADGSGVLYGCVDFINRYCGSELWMDGYLWKADRFDRPFDKPLRPYRSASAPAIAKRAIWTWGHVIYDYREFFDNMALLRLNEVVIWNDHVPFNASDVVDYAHSLGIKVVWGFAWGWSTKCEELALRFDRATLDSIKQSVLETYERDYAGAGGDGIYFQSFTEMSREEVGGKSVAELVTELVNETASELLSRYPELHIQFGLHATSVKSRLDVIAKVDPRIYIVWEDCGAFPFAYGAHEVENAAETEEFCRKIARLRGGKGFGAVPKGMSWLDWSQFAHQTGPFLLGISDRQEILEKYKLRADIFRHQTSYWLENGEVAFRMIRVMAEETKGNAMICGLLEDGMFEESMWLPAVLFARMLWDGESDYKTLLGKASRAEGWE